MDKTRIDSRFAACKAENRPALVGFITAGDPDLATSMEIFKAMPKAGIDVIELGMPFSDPMAEGVPIQLATQRALAAGQTMEKTLQMVRDFRKDDKDTPIILMGYYNPIYSWGSEKFVKDAKEAGVDGLIVVDLPPEHDDELCLPARDGGLNFIRLATPTTDDATLTSGARKYFWLCLLCLCHRYHRHRGFGRGQGGARCGSHQGAHGSPGCGWLWC